jgi:hypothetical protein
MNLQSHNTFQYQSYNPADNNEGFLPNPFPLVQPFDASSGSNYPLHGLPTDYASQQVCIPFGRKKKTLSDFQNIVMQQNMYGGQRPEQDHTQLYLMSYNSPLHDAVPAPHAARSHAMPFISQDVSYQQPPFSGYVTRNQALNRADCSGHTVYVL